MKISKGLISLVSAIALFAGSLTAFAVEIGEKSELVATEALVTTTSAVTRTGALRVQTSRRPFIKFDLGDYSDKYIKATPSIKLQVNVASFNGAYTMGLYIDEINDLSVDSDVSAIFSGGTFVGEAAVSGKGLVTYDVTNAVKSHPDKICVFKLISDKGTDNRLSTISADASTSPKLIFEYSDEGCAEYDLASINVPETVADDFTLPVSGTFSDISWTSDNSAISIEGANARVTRPNFADGNTAVTLKATAVVNDVTKTKDFKVIVEKLSEVISGDILKVVATADTYVVKSYADTNYSTSNYLQVNGTGRNAFIRFESDNTQAMNGAGVVKLNLYVQSKTDGKIPSIILYALDGADITSWSEDTATFNVLSELNLVTADSGAGAEVGNQSDVLAGTWYSFDVTDYAKGITDGKFAFRMNGSPEAKISSREVEGYEPYLEFISGDTADVMKDVKSAVIPTGAFLDFSLPQSQNGCNITYSSDNEAIIIDGAVARVANVDEDKAVTIMAEFQKGDYSQAVTYPVAVVAKPIVLSISEIVSGSADVSLDQRLSMPNNAILVAGAYNQNVMEIINLTKDGSCTIDLSDTATNLKAYLLDATNLKSYATISLSK